MRCYKIDVRSYGSVLRVWISTETSLWKTNGESAVQMFLKYILEEHAVGVGIG